MMESLVPLVVLLLCSGLTAYGATYVVRQAAVRAGLFDRPGDERRIHETDTPRLGGLAIIFGFGFPLLLGAANAHAAQLVSKNISSLCALLAAGSFLVGPGVYDDNVRADTSRKFALQFVVAPI